MREAFLGATVTSSSPFGDLVMGVVDAQAPGVAEGVSRLLMRSIQDARAEVGGHLPSWLVDDIERNYISPERVRTLWAEFGHRFAVMLGDEIVGTVHVAKRSDVILTVDRHRINVPVADFPGFKPERHHHVVNLSVKHELRRARIGAWMIDRVITDFRTLFDGVGLWVRADPPWHPGLAGLGFVHDPSLDVFLPETAERTADLPHDVFNRVHACACAGSDRPERARAMATKKLQYVSFTRSFGAARTVTPARDAIAETLAAATREGRRLVVRGAGTGTAPPPRETIDTTALDRIVAVRGDRVTVQAGVTWRSLLAALPDGVFPPVVPGFIDATIGGTLSTGGIGKGSIRDGLVIDHVRALVVVTGDGRRVACSRAQARWLFDAVLGGYGLFGVIVEATLALAPMKPRVLVTKRAVASREVGGALDVDAYHSVAVAQGGAWLTVVARETEAGGDPIRSFVMSPRAVAPIVPRLQVVAAREELAGVLDRIPADAIAYVHPVRRSGERHSLLVPEVQGTIAFVVTIEPPCDVGDVRRTLQSGLPENEPAWRAWLGARWDDVVRARQLADPGGVLSTSF